MKMGNVEIPEWVNWIATDADGKVYGYRYKPIRTKTFISSGLFFVDSKANWTLPEMTDNSLTYNQVLISLNPLPLLSPKDEEPYEVLWGTDKESFRLKNKRASLYSGTLMKLLDPLVPVSDAEFVETEPETTESNMSRFSRMVDEMTTDQYELFVDFVNDEINNKMTDMFTDDDKD